uniref:Cytochrome p450 n=1 Tax=Croton stellatopilosus TaxID=431156 RepID=A0A3G2CJW6_9ROSI|nr:cytochrome p450 [Croton stellatopilosus]
MELQTFLFSLLNFFLFIFIVQKLWKKSKKANKSSHLPPGPLKLPVIGNMHNLMGSLLPHQSFQNLAKTYGPLMHLQLGEITTIVVSSPEVAKRVMKTQDTVFANRPKLLAPAVLSYNYTNIMNTSYGEYWRQLRKICVLELLSARRVQSFKSIRKKELSNFVKCISSSSGSLINLSKMLLSLAYSTTSRAAVGEISKDQGQAFVPLVQEIVEVASGFTVADFFPSIKLLHRISGMRPKVERLFQEVDKILGNIIDEHKGRASASSNKDEANDLVDVLLNIQERGGLSFDLTTNNIKAVILDIFIGGSETSSSVLEWAMSELIKNPNVMKKAQAEVREIFHSKGYVDEEKLSELNYLKLIVKETLRLHPPISLLPRQNSESSEINGYFIPAKSRVLINAWAVGRDPNYWEDAEKFKPERFLDNSIDYKGNNFEFLPFGAGRRTCPGMLFGIVNVELPLANLLYHFDWKLPEEMNEENLDMTEAFGGAIRRENHLNLIPVTIHSTPLEKFI